MANKHVISGQCPKCQKMLYDGLADPTMRSWFEDLQARQPEVHISYVYRGKEEQNKLKREGKSKASFGLSPHNYKPCLAIDIFFLVNNSYYLDEQWLIQIASQLPDEVMWGGDFNRNGTHKDESFVDMPHFQRVDWKSLTNNFPEGDK